MVVEAELVEEADLQQLYTVNNLSKTGDFKPWQVTKAAYLLSPLDPRI